MTQPTPVLRHYPPPGDHVRAGLDAVLAGAYDVPELRFETAPRVLDLGAHCGSFSVWVCHRFPGAHVVAFEPHPTSAHYARLNTHGLEVDVRPLAVVGHAKSLEGAATLYEGIQNTGQRSIYQLGEQRNDGIPVPLLSARELPPCDVLKIDTEGCELPVLRDYLHLAGVRCLMLEWHSLADYQEMLGWLPELGFVLARDDAKGAMVADRTLVFLRALPKPLAAPRHPLDGAGLNEPSTPVLFQVPRSSLAMLTELAPSYDLHALPDLARPFVLDLGAHVGGFAWYALLRWPDAHILSFEAHADTAALLRSNLAGLPVDVRHGAVVHPRTSPTVRLYEGVHGRHECSVRDDVRWPHCSQRLDMWTDAPTFDAAHLPPCDVLKIDTEGSEVAILTAYASQLARVRVLLCEAHPVGGNLEANRVAIRHLAKAAGLTELAGHVMRFMRR